MSNQELSEQRAAAVLKYLVKYGVSQDRLESKGWGEALPMFPQSQKARNRRVEFHIQGRQSEKGLRDLVATESKRKRLAGDQVAIQGTCPRERERARGNDRNLTDGRMQLRAGATRSHFGYTNTLHAAPMHAQKQSTTHSDSETLTKQKS